jgi:hypothetical protein
MQAKSNSILTIMNVLVWIAFIGLCIKAGAILFTFFMSLFITPAAAGNLYSGLDLSDLMNVDEGKYMTLVSLILAIWVLQAYLFYCIIRIIKVGNLANPFSEAVYNLIVRVSYVALGIGILAHTAQAFTSHLVKRGVELRTAYEYVGGGPEFLFLAGTVYVIALVFKRGLEIQSEHELTV